MQFSIIFTQRIKKWVWTGMLQQWFTYLSISNIERDIANYIQTEYGLKMIHYIFINQYKTYGIFICDIGCNLNNIVF